MISVLVPTYKRPEKLRRCLEAIAAQTHRDLEVVVVNDGGPSVQEVVWTLGGRIPIHLREEKENRGHVAARNVALSLASGNLIALCDDDDTYDRDHLESLAGAIDASDLVYAGTRIRAERPDGTFDERVLSWPYDPKRLRETNFIVPSSVLYRRALHDALGTFDPRLVDYWDWDWALRVAEHGRIAHVPKVSVTYGFSIGGENLSARPERMREDLARLSAKHALGPLPSTNFYLMALNDAAPGGRIHG